MRQEFISRKKYKKKHKKCEHCEISSIRHVNFYYAFNLLHVAQFQLSWFSSFLNAIVEILNAISHHCFVEF